MDLSLFYLPTWRSGYGTTLTQFYEDVIETVRLADRLGWARVLTTEHHFHYYGGAVPNPAVFLSALARETETIRLGAGVSLMQLRDPLKVAEDYALLDQLSGGRADMGFAKGFVPHEFEAFHIDPAEVPERLREGLEICRQFWKGEAFSHQGNFFEFEKLQPWPETVRGSLPIWAAASNSKESFVNAAQQGFHLMMNQYPMSFEQLVERFGWYRDAWAGANRDAADIRALCVLLTHIADTEEQAIEEAQPALQEHAGAFGKLLQGRQWDTDYASDISTLMQMCDGDDVRDVFRRRTLICSPEQAAERIARYRDAGFTELGILPRFTGLSHDQAIASMQRLQNDVMPMIGA